jgi:hypothetical protein
LAEQGSRDPHVGHATLAAPSHSVARHERFVTATYSAGRILATQCYFHAATAYDILRWKGVQIGKRDFMGSVRMKQPVDRHG